MSDYSSQTVAQLKDILKSRGLSVEGKKADLVSRLIDSDNANTEQAGSPAKAADAPIEATVAVAVEVEETKGDNNNASTAKPVPVTTESALTVIQPSNDLAKEVTEPPKVLTAEERKQLAIELLNKKVSRAEKFGDEKAAEQARKDLQRVEKFGVELGTALAREIGLVDKSLGTHNRGKFKSRRFNARNNHGGFKKNRGNRH
ncbi:hypothetical protein KGF56_001943 [Candida oxycetoniae]|uniref:SAP domain-containing protein n=1 Tax=Candida oxycetoniae TaxID=497107 RepID=A0AAI9SYR0_9ASCO|nr:uncharacterized protein KGF56_001943 [Candida oxycetoniae]KAI3405251.1 hypothetical protein KGF56_001943 [Candida oxycetoniae]